MAYCTDHAILRYIQRVKGVNLRPIRKHLRKKWGRKPTDKEVLCVIGAYTERSIKEMREWVVSDHVRLAVDAGCERYYGRDATYILRDKRIVTVLRPKQRERSAA